MGYLNKNLNPGETVLYETRLHWIVMIKSIIIACILIAVAGFLVYYTQTNASLDTNTLHLLEGAAVVCLLAAIIAFVLGAVHRNATEMAVTNHRVVIKIGLVGRRTIEMILNKVESIEVRESSFGRMLGYGTIIVIGSGGTLEPFHQMAHPHQFRSAVQQQIEKLP